MANNELELKEEQLSDETIQVTPTRRARKINTMDRSLLRDSLKGSTKFLGPKYDLGVIRECIEDLQIQSDTYKLKNTKPVIKFYGSYNEMLQLLMMRQGGVGENDWSPNIFDTFMSKPANFSAAETGQEVYDEDFDE